MAITVTPPAHCEILRLLSRAQASSPVPANLRISIMPGGCAGQVYKLDFHGAPRPGDLPILLEDVTLWVDGPNWPLLQTLTLDYSEDLMGGSFRFDNAAVSQSCNCGQSFALSQADAPSS
jgi:iron-sulfur cluster assembly protein